MRGEITFSIIIPTYNQGELLRVALSSVINQTLGSWEAIIINNYSIDNTLGIANSFNDPRIKVVNFRNNNVIAASRNFGVKLARGIYISFLDSDDYWCPEKLERVKVLLDEGCDLVCHGEIWRKNGKDLKSVRYGPVHMADYNSLLFNRNCISTSAVTISKTLLQKVGGFSEDVSFAMVEDYDLWLKIARSGGYFQFIDEMLGVYNIHNANTSRATYRQMRAELNVLKTHFSNKKIWTIRERIYKARRFARVYLSYFLRGIGLR